MSAAVQHPDEQRRYSALEGIGAIRLAIEAGGVDEHVCVSVLREILKRLPEPSNADVAPVNLLVEALQAAGGELRMTDHEPRRLRRQEATP